MNVTALLQECMNLGATIVPVNNRLRITAPKPLPVELMSELKAAKYEILNELHGETALNAECWVLEEWWRTSIPKWRATLRKSIELKGSKAEEYARWMLREILDDPEYTE